LAVELGGELGLSEQERGDESDPTLRAIAGVLAENIPDARFVELAHCGHVTYAEQPAAFAAAVLAFTGALAPAPR
jgi:pimeloyl-ACP methyl ester carboxylesterase